MNHQDTKTPMVLTIDHLMRSYWALRTCVKSEIREYLDYRKRKRYAPLATLSLSTAKSYGESLRALRAAILAEWPEAFGPQKEKAA